MANSGNSLAWKLKLKIFLEKEKSRQVPTFESVQGQ
jgi:hypothetical protein